MSPLGSYRDNWPRVGALLRRESRAMALNVAFAVTSIAGPNIALKDKDSPYRFTAEQMGPHLPGRGR